MHNKAPSLSPKRTGSKREHKIAGFVIVFVWACITPALFGQQDVHAALISSANRKPAPAFQLVTDSGRKIADFRLSRNGRSTQLLGYRVRRLCA